MASRLPASTLRRSGGSMALAECAAQLAQRIPRERLDPAVVRWADSAPKRQRWGVAFSGGADSLALLLLVWAHWPERRANLTALHFDHRLRGAESRADAAFCRRMARLLGTTYVAGAWRRSPEDVSEAEARAARMAFLEKHARVLWLGHQQDDIAETMLMRLARGSGTGGLAAPRPVQVLRQGRVHLRPLLGLKKDEIVAALRAVGLAWREDSTNRLPHYFRNRIRRDVLPAWTAAAQRDSLAGAARSRLLLEEDDAALEAWLWELNPFGQDKRLLLGKLRGKPRALWRRALHRWLMNEPRAGQITSASFDTLLAAIEEGRPTRHSLGRHGFARTDGSELWFEPLRKRRPKFLRQVN